MSEEEDEEEDEGADNDVSSFLSPVHNASLELDDFSDGDFVLHKKSHKKNNNNNNTNNINNNNNTNNNNNNNNNNKLSHKNEKCLETKTKVSGVTNAAYKASKTKNINFKSEFLDLEAEVSDSDGKDDDDEHDEDDDEDGNLEGFIASQMTQKTRFKGR